MATVKTHERRSDIGPLSPGFLSLLQRATASDAYVTPALDAAGEPLRRIKLLPFGPIVAKDGRRWLLDNPQAVVAATLQALGQTQMMGDYDHQLVFAAVPGVGGRAPASGWVKELHAEADGVWATVDWTAEAERQLRAKEYRYISPYFSHEAASGRITRIINFALVNNPAITELPAVASALEADPNPQGPSMKFTEQLAQALGLQATATEAQILEAVTNQTSAASTAFATTLTPIAEALGLAADAKPDAIVAAASAAVAAKADPTKFVPIEALSELQTQVTALTTGAAEDKATAAVDLASEQGKLSPALRDWGLEHARKDLASFNSWAAAAPVVVPPNERPTKGGKLPANTATTLTDEQKAAASALGLSEADMLAATQETV